MTEARRFPPRSCAALLFPLAAGLLAACDPCSGVAACIGEPRIAVEGELVRQKDGDPVGGVRVEMIRVGGVGAARDTLVTRTDADGRFRFVLDADERGSVVADFLVYPPSREPYRVEEVELETTSVRGDGRVFQQWVSEPYFPYAGELYDPTTGRVIAGARVMFQRTGGAQLFGEGLQLDGISYITQTDAGGRFVLREIWPRDSSYVVGDLTIDHAGRTSTVRGIRLESTHLASAPTQILRVGAWSVLNAVGELYYRDTQKRAEGVTVEFRRTGGARVEPDTFVVRTDRYGRFPIFLRPESDGVVEFELGLRPPAPYAATTLSGLRAQANNRSQAELIGVWGVGKHLLYVGELAYEQSGLPVEGAEIEFRRTGGMLVQPGTFTVRSDGAGRFPLQPRPLQQEGEVVFDLLVRPPAPAAPFTLRGLTMSPHADEQARLLAVWAVATP